MCRVVTSLGLSSPGTGRVRAAVHAGAASRSVASNLGPRPSCPRYSHRGCSYVPLVRWVRSLRTRGCSILAGTGVDRRGRPATSRAPMPAPAPGPTRDPSSSPTWRHVVIGEQAVAAAVDVAETLPAKIERPRLGPIGRRRRKQEARGGGASASPLEGEDDQQQQQARHARRSSAIGEPTLETIPEDHQLSARVAGRGADAGLPHVPAPDELMAQRSSMTLSTMLDTVHANRRSSRSSTELLNRIDDLQQARWNSGRLHSYPNIDLDAATGSQAPVLATVGDDDNEDGNTPEYERLEAPSIFARIFCLPCASYVERARIVRQRHKYDAEHLLGRGAAPEPGRQ